MDLVDIAPPEMPRAECELESTVVGRAASSPVNSMDTPLSGRKALLLFVHTSSPSLSTSAVDPAHIILPESPDTEELTSGTHAIESTSLPRDPVNTPLATTPDTSALPSATAAVLAASSAIPKTAQGPRNVLFAQLRHVATSVFTTFFTDSTRQSYSSLFTHVRTKLTTIPPNYCHVALALLILALIAEYQQPGCTPRLNALFGLACAAVVFFGSLACLDFVEEYKWPWQEDGWVWPWEAWLWRETVYGLGASTNSEPMSSYRSAFASTSNDHETMPPPFIIPPTPFLPGGLRLKPFPAHRSGIMGASPMPPKTTHVSGNAFARSIKLG